MGRSIEMPGVVGDLCIAMESRSRAAKELGKNTSSLYRWAHNLTKLGGSEQKLLQRLCDEYAVSPRLYRQKGARAKFVASTANGWVTFPDKENGWTNQTYWEGNPTELKECDAGDAKKAGFPQG